MFVLKLVLLIIFTSCMSSHDHNLQRTGLDFSKVQSQDQLPELINYPARDGHLLYYRKYGHTNKAFVILLHGSAYHSRYLSILAKSIHDKTSLDVITPDIRGHGPKTTSRGDVSYIGQLEDDLVDLIKHLQHKHGKRKIVLGGHSSGGGLALRFAGSQYKKMVSAYVLISPYVSHKSPTSKENSGGWSQVNLLKIIPLTTLNHLNVSFFNDTHVISFNMPREVQDGSETLSYSYRMMTSFNPRDNYQDDIDSLPKETIIYVGEKDEAFNSEQFQNVFMKNKVEIIPKTKHLDIVKSPFLIDKLSKWLVSMTMESR